MVHGGGGEGVGEGMEEWRREGRSGEGNGEGSFIRIKQKKNFRMRPSLSVSVAKSATQNLSETEMTDSKSPGQLIKKIYNTSIF